MHSLCLFVSLMAFYVVLSGQIASSFLMGAGVVACLGVTLLAKRLGIVDDEGVPYRYWWPTIKYIPWLIWQIVLSSIAVLKLVWQPKMDIQPQMVVIKHDLRTAYGVATYMNSITLTPGTVTVDIGKDELLVHCITKAVADDLKGGEMERRIRAIEESSPVHQEARR
jgi:multicomponent Na+:H+ antiporter subunit E